MQSYGDYLLALSLVTQEQADAVNAYAVSAQVWRCVVRWCLL